MKKFLTILLSLVLILSVIPMSAFTANAAVSGYYTYEVSNEKATITDFNEYVSGAISVPSSLGGYPVTAIGDYAFWGCYSLTEIKIPNSVTSIGYGTLAYCSNLESIIVESGNTVYHSSGNCLIETDTKNLISGCKNSIIPNDGSVTSIGEYAFMYCTSLTEITIPDSVKSIGEEAFCSCENLATVTIGNSVTSIGDYAFYSCENLATVTIGNSVTSIGDGAFVYCYRLTEITIPNSVTSIGTNPFVGCRNLESIIVESGNTVYHSSGNCLIETDTKNLISGCKNSVIPDDRSVTSIGDDAFCGCSLLTEIIIPDSVTSIGDDAFDCCDSLTEIIIPNSVTSIGDDAFWGCSSLTEITIPNSVTSIGDSAFKYCSTLTEITIPDSITSIGDGAFDCCYALTEITISDSVTSIGEEAFSWCSSLTEITIPDSVTIIGADAFFGCENLATVTIGKGVTSIGDYAFYNCKNLKTVYNYSSLNIVKGSITNGYVACYADNVYKLPCTNHTGRTATCIKKAKCTICGQEYGSLKSHTYSNACDTTCNVCNAKRTVSGHKYSNSCDNNCNVCGAKRSVSHSYKTTGTTKATLSKDGKIVKKCSKCGGTTTTTIKKIKTVKLSATSYTYNGKAKKPSVSVKDSAGKTISSSNYTVSYQSGRKNVGKYKVTIKFKGNYSGTKTLYFTIKPVKTTVKSITAGKKQLKVNITKKSTQVTGYQIQYSTSKKFTSAKTKTINSYKTTSATIKSLKAKKNYYVRVRSFKTVGKTKYYSAWSSAKSKKTK